MRRINANALKDVGGLHLFNGEPFGGEALFFQKGLLERKVTLVAGKIMEDNIYDSTVETHVDADVLDVDEGLEQCFWKGETFSGCAYEFEEGLCIAESRYSEGELSSEESWFKTGQRGSLEVFEKDLHYNIWWYPDGQIKKVKLIEKGSYKVEIRKDTEGLVTVLQIDGVFFESAPRLSSEFIEFLPANKKQLSKIKFAQELFITGSDIDDEVIQTIQSSEGIENLRSLSLYDTNITDETLLTIVDILALREIQIDDDNQALLSIAKTIKTKQPSISVLYNSAVIG